MYKTAAISAVLLSAFAMSPALAATQAECEAAIAKTQNDMESNAGAMMEKDSIRQEWSLRLDEANGYGAQGDPEKCLTTVKGVRGEAGLGEL